MKKSTLLIILMHLVYWQPPFAHIYYLSFDPTAGGGLDFEINLLNWIIGTALAIIVFYVFYFFIFPSFLYRPQFIKFTLWSAATIIAAIGLGAIFNTYYLNHVYTPEQLRHVIGLSATGISTSFVVKAAVAACVMKGFITWFTEISYKARLEQQNTDVKLALVKAQINPHFLFNTLNNIDVLIEKDPTTASTYLKKLSDILRFTLHEAPSDTIALNKEINHIEQYLDLQKIRSTNSNFVQFDTAAVANSDLQIAPMLFMPFIENAFKYSTNKKIDNAIAITLKTQGNHVIFSCVNVYDVKQQITAEDGGLGLDLIKNRLELLYPNNYKLDIAKTADRFTISLTVTII